jgi:hypothetical protein
MQAVNARLDMIKIYMPQKEEIISLYKKGDFEALTPIFEEYDMAVKEHLKNAKMTLFFDKDIMDVYTVQNQEVENLQEIKKMIL